MFVTNWISTTKIQKISEITNFFRHYFLSRTEVVIKNYIHFSLIQYGKKVLLQIVFVSIVSLLLVFTLSYLVGTTDFYVFVYYPLGLIANATIIYLIGLYPDERQMVVNKIKNIISVSKK